MEVCCCNPSRGHSLSLTYLQRLPTLASNVLTEDELDRYDLEARRFQTDSLPEFKKGQRIDDWWGSEDIVSKYPCLSKMVVSLLSCFHGPQVESSFNVMNDIIDCKSGRINIETYNSVQNIKYGLTVEHLGKVLWVTTRKMIFCMRKPI